MMRISRRALTAEPGDQGFALLTVIGAMGVITMFLLSSLAYVLSATRPSRADQDDKAAVAAAQAGIDEYVARLNSNDTYWTRGNNDCPNLALPPPTTPGCATPHPPAGIPVPGTAGAATFSYRLLSTNATTTADGIIRLAVTGRSRGESRELVAQLSPSGFLQYIYYTDFESGDPGLSTGGQRAYINGQDYTASGNNPTIYRYWYTDENVSNAFCATRHWYEGRSNPGYNSGTYLEYTQTGAGSSYQGTTGPVVKTLTAGQSLTYGCSEIQFTSGDKIRGPLKTNDAMLLNGTPWFTDPVTETAYTNPGNPTRPWRGTGTPSNGTGAEPGYPPITSTRLEMPDSNAELVGAATTSSTGCVYTGATRIVFKSDGTMDVTSPATDGSVPRCYTGGATAQNVTVPSVMYVKEATSCTLGVGYPLPGEDSTQGASPDYNCRRGNAYVSGVLKGRTTIGTSNDIVVVGNTTYQGALTGTDALGLIPQNYAWIYHPVNGAGNNLLGSPVSQLDAAVLSVAHSFVVQNWGVGSALGNLRIRGAIAQRYRGAVGTGGGSGASTGYIKDYNYDKRLLNAPPPYFLKPVTSPYAVTRLTD